MINIAKKIFSVFTAVTLSAQIFGVSNFNSVEAAQSRRILFKDSFNSCITNDIPSNGVYDATDVHVTNRVKGSDKSVEFKTSKATSSATYDFSESVSEAVISLEIKLTGDKCGFSFSVRGGDNKWYKLLSQNAEGDLCNSSGSSVGGIGNGAYNKIALAYNAPDKSYDVYLGGKCVLKRWPYSSAPSEISSFKIDFDSVGNTTVNLDNIIAYTGTDYSSGDASLSAALKETYNNEETEFTPDEPEEEYSALISNRTFDKEDIDDLDTIACQDRGGKAKIYVNTDETTGNKYMKCNIDSDGNDCYSVVSIKSPGSYLVLSYDIRSENDSNVNGNFNINDENNTTISTLVTYRDGVIKANKSSGQVSIGSVTDKWTNISCVLNKSSCNFDVYINGVLKAENCGPYSSDNTAEVTSMTFYNYRGTNLNLSVGYDNIIAYEGSEIRNVSPEEKAERRSTLISNEYSEKLLKNSVAVHESSDYIFYGGERHDKENKAYKTLDGVHMESLSDLEKAFGFTAEYDASSGIIKFKDSEYTVGSLFAKINGTTVSLSNAPEIRNGIVYLPFRDVAEKSFKKKIFYDGRGIIIAKSTSMSFNTKDIQYMSNYMLYPRPDSSEIKEMMSSKTDIHPRVLINSDDVSKIRDKYKNNSYMHTVGNSTISRADMYVTTQTTPPKYDPKGDLLTQARAIYGRMTSLSAAYLLTNDRKYVDRAWVDLEAVCGDAYPEWRLEHLITASEMAVGVSIAYDWMYDAWTDEQKSFMEKALIEKYIRPSEKKYFMENTLYYHVPDNTNRGAVNNGGSIICGIAMFEKDPELCSSIIENGLRALEYMTDMFYPDGAWHEGTMYWAYMSDYLVNTVSTLESTFGSDFNILKTPALDKSAYFSIYSGGPTGIDNFEDSNYEQLNTATYMWYANKFDNPGIGNLRKFNSNNGKDSASVKDLIWYDPEWESMADIDLPFDRKFGGIEYASMRNSFYDKSATFLGLHGGAVESSHGHMDNGSFVVDMLGERWATDIPHDDYSFVQKYQNQQYFLYRRSPEGHNCLVINPTGNSYYQNTTATSIIKDMQSKERGAFTVLDLSSAYSDNATSVIRGYRLTSDRRAVEIRDELKLKDAYDTYWFMQTEANVTVSEDGKSAILEKNGKKVKFMFETDAKEYKLTAEKPAKPLDVTPKIDGQADNSKYTRIAVKMTGSSEMYIHVRMVPADAPESEKPIDNVEIAEWSIPDGKIENIPVLDTIYLNGNPISGFEPTNTSYNFVVENINTFPFEVTANDSDSYTVKIMETKSDEMISKTVRVISRNNPELYRDYLITVSQPEQLPDIEGMKRLPIYDYDVSEEPEEANNRYNANDNDLSTRFTMSSDDAYLIYDLGSIKRIDNIGVAVWKANERLTRYDIAVSDDKTNWTTIYSGSNTVKTDTVELKNITPVSARYVKIIGHGNSVNNYTNILEFAILQNK